MTDLPEVRVGPGLDAGKILRRLYAGVLLLAIAGFAAIALWGVRREPPPIERLRPARLEELGAVERGDLEQAERLKGALLAAAILRAGWRYLPPEGAWTGASPPEAARDALLARIRPCDRAAATGLPGGALRRDLRAGSARLPAGVSGHPRGLRGDPAGRRRGMV